MIRIGVLVSGNGTNLQSLIDAQIKGSSPCGEAVRYSIEAVFSDCAGAYAVTRAKKAGIPVELVSAAATVGLEQSKQLPRNEKRLIVSNRILELSRLYRLDALVLAGFLTILCGGILTEYANKMINLHPALLPKFGGEGMWGSRVHEAVLASGETESGCTVHLVDSGCDTGKILVQRRVPVYDGDTPDSLAGRIHEQEFIAIVEGVQILEGILDTQV